MRPRYSILMGYDHDVAQWCWRAFNLFPMPYNLALGIMDRDRNNALVGAAIFDQWNGHNIELSYYGPKTPTAGIVRMLARAALNFNVQRVSMRTSSLRGPLIKQLSKLGFEIESVERHFYGFERHAVRMVIFRPLIERTARFDIPAKEVETEVATKQAPSGQYLH